MSRSTTPSATATRPPYHHCWRNMDTDSPTPSRSPPVKSNNLSSSWLVINDCFFLRDGLAFLFFLAISKPLLLFVAVGYIYVFTREIKRFHIPFLLRQKVDAILYDYALLTYSQYPSLISFVNLYPYPAFCECVVSHIISDYSSLREAMPYYALRNSGKLCLNWHKIFTTRTPKAIRLSGWMRQGRVNIPVPAVLR